MLKNLALQSPDPLLGIIVAFRSDSRPTKLDLGVGVYKDERGATPVFAAVKAAERLLLETQPSKAYLGPEGDVEYVERLLPLVLGTGFDAGRISGLQTPGGTGALRLAAELIALADPHARVMLGVPTWPNHLPIIEAARIETSPYPYFDVRRQAVDFDGMMAALERGRRGDVVLLQASCHNPLGADLDERQWKAVAGVVSARGLVPLVDCAYQGLGAGMEQDVRGARLVLRSADEALLAYSCDKNFGLYRERVGALFTLSRSSGQAAITKSNLLALARANWSMPPDHGAAVVRTILADDDLTAAWSSELDCMRERIVGVRSRLAAAHPMLSPLAGQFGMFSTLPLTVGEVERLRAERGVYMTASGRINVAGLTPATIEQFAEALASIRPTS